MGGPADLPVVETFVRVDGFRLRCIETGQGPAVLFLHGASPGSSGDVYRRNMQPVAAAGFRALALDLPGYGGSDKPDDHSGAFRLHCIEGLVRELALDRVALVGHSQSGTPAVQLALREPDRYPCATVLATGSLLPPLDAGVVAAAPDFAPGLDAEPTVGDIRRLLEANLWHHELITPDVVAFRHGLSTGANFAAFVARSRLPDAPRDAGVPLWQRLVELGDRLLIVHGAQDRGNARERAEKLKALYPQLNLHIVDRCRHLLPWDAAEKLEQLLIPFLRAHLHGQGAST